MSSDRPRIGWAALILGLCLVACTLIIGEVVAQTKLSNRSIGVKGYAEKRIRSDFGIWRGQITARAPQLADGYALIEKQTARVLQFLGEKDIPKGAVALAPLGIETRYRHGEQGVETSTVDSYVLRQGVTVSLADPAKIETLTREANPLVKEGIEFTATPPEFYYTELESLKVDMLGEAARDARRRAEKIAASGGLSIDKLRSARQGVFQITPVYSTEVSGYGVLDNTTVDKTIKAIVDAEFGVK
jgi:uncharacterized protein